MQGEEIKRIDSVFIEVGLVKAQGFKRKILN